MNIWGTIATVVVTVLVTSIILYTITAQDFQETAISKKHAYYHPITKEFTWLDEACGGCGRTKP